MFVKKNNFTVSNEILVNIILLIITLYREVYCENKTFRSCKYNIILFVYKII